MSRLRSLLGTRQTAVRFGFLILIFVSALLLGQSYVAAGGIPQHEYEDQFQLPLEDRDQVVAPRDGITVITTQGPLHRFERASIVAFTPDGRVLYFNNTHDSYFDVDPSPKGETTVTYVASIEKKEWDPIKRNVVERLNLTTGEVTRLYTYVTRGKWHDADRVGDSRFLVADIGPDKVSIVNTSSGVITWEWSARRYLPVEPPDAKSDITHLNDVELLADGRVMVSLRNQDQVVFIDRETGVRDNWTLGEDNDHEILHEQHNPDYIPAERGGPAVVVSDSENNRIVEYQRRDASWERTWTWQSSRLQWPRDADRLPNRHTLVTNSNGDEVFEVDASGDTVWQADIYLPYEAERLNTGDESAAGPAATAADIDSRETQAATQSTERATPISETLFGLAKIVVPSRILNGIVFALPAWMGKNDIIPLGILVISSILWGGMKVYWSRYRIAVRRPVRIFRTQENDE